MVLFAVTFSCGINLAYVPFALAQGLQNEQSRAITRQRRTRAQRPTRGQCDPTKQEQTDLSGTYTGKATLGNEPAEDATLTVTGNQFTLTSGSETQSGRITAVTTCGYTAVTMMMGDMTPPRPGPNPPPPQQAISLQAKKKGDQINLISVDGQDRKLSFQCDCSKCASHCDCCP
jgi:hypothetical protein